MPPLGRPLRVLPPSSRDHSPPFWFDVERHGVERPSFPRLAADVREVDAVVVGAGIVGLKLARYLARYGKSVVVLEGSAIGDQAASSRNQGCFQHTASGDDFEAAADDAAALERLGVENRRLARALLTQYEQLPSLEACTS